MCEQEILEKLKEDFGKLTDNIELSFREISSNKVLAIATFKIAVETMISHPNNMTASDKPLQLTMFTWTLLKSIEQYMYECLTFAKVECPSPLGNSVKVRIDSHIPDNVVFMSPKTYVSCKAKSPAFFDMLREE